MRGAAVRNGQRFCATCERHALRSHQLLKNGSGLSYVLRKASQIARSTARWLALGLRQKAMENYDRVAPRLYQGGAPDPSKPYSEFDAIFLCAAEYQPPRFPKFKGTIIRCGFKDTLQPTAHERRIAIRAAREVAKRLGKGQTVLVTCYSGWNRSGLVVGLALRMATRLSADEIIQRIRKARGDSALSNPSFERIVRGFNARRGRLGELARRARSTNTNRQR